MKTIPIKNVNPELDRILLQHKQATINGIQAAVIRLHQIILTVYIPMTNPNPVDRGLYRAGWTVDLLPNGAKLRNYVPWALFIEYGVLPKNVKASKKMIQALAEWILRKGFARKMVMDKKSGKPTMIKDKDAQALAMAYAISTIMKKKTGIHGKTGRKILEKCIGSFWYSMLEAEVQRELNKVTQ